MSHPPERLTPFDSATPATKSDRDGRPFSVDNAGVVLLAAFLPQLFRQAGINDGGPFRDATAAWQAAHLVQHFTDAGDSGDHPTSPLSRVLCGLSPTEDRAATLSTDQRALCDSALHAVLKHWPEMGQVSVVGLRETFLQRPGRLERHEDTWRLKVERRTVDVLIDRFPLSFSVIRHPWMTVAVHVVW